MTTQEPKGPHMLQSWMDLEGKTQQQIADAVGVAQPSVADWLSGRKRPTFDNAKTVSKVTRGAVPLEAWAA